ncbi:MAG: succinate dehydrogenase cytochrome b subunit [Gemmatimonadota bacterium]
MRRAMSLYRTTVGQKAVMAITGVVLLLFLIGHMLGNLKVYLGPQAYNHYAEWLREAGTPLLPHGGLLWIARVVLLVSVGAHIFAALQLTRRSRAARDERYHTTPHEELSYASRTMRWGGVIIFLFVIFHLMNFTWGNAHPDFVPGDVYHNFIAGFEVWQISAIYILFMVVLGFHIYHGVWSGMQTLGLNQPRYNRYRRPLAAVLALTIAVGNISFPTAVLAGWLR